VSKGGGGGGTTTTSPWGPAQPYIKEGLRGLQAAYRNPAQFFPGQTFVGPTPSELAAWGNRLSYSDQVYGGSQAPKFGEATGALSGALTGNTALGSLAGNLAPFAGNALMGGWSGFGQAGGLDARGAIGNMLSGQPDYSGLQGAIDAANAPILRQLNQDILPGLERRASFLQNPTGSIKALNRVMPEIGERMSQNAQALYQGERNRALGERAQAANLVSQGGLSMNQGLIGLGGLAGNLGAGASGDALRGLALFPGMVQAGEGPGNLAQQFAGWGRGFQEQALADQMARFNFYQNQPMDWASRYLAMGQGAGGLGGTQAQKNPDGSPIAGALGGAITGAQLGTMIPGIGPAVGAIGGGLLGLFG
jgi:hypothetical protein